MQNFNIEYATELQDQEILRVPFDVILDLMIKLAELRQESLIQWQGLSVISVRE